MDLPLKAGQKHMMGLPLKAGQKYVMGRPLKALQMDHLELVFLVAA
jgi:hypothetical protein